MWHTLTYSGTELVLPGRGFFTDSGTDRASLTRTTAYITQCHVLCPSHLRAIACNHQFSPSASSHSHSAVTHSNPAAIRVAWPTAFFQKPLAIYKPTKAISLHIYIRTCVFRTLSPSLSLCFPLSSVFYTDLTRDCSHFHAAPLVFKIPFFLRQTLSTAFGWHDSCFHPNYRVPTVAERRLSIWLLCKISPQRQCQFRCMCVCACMCILAYLYTCVCESM